MLNNFVKANNKMITGEIQYMKWLNKILKNTEKNNRKKHEIKFIK